MRILINFKILIICLESIFLKIKTQTLEEVIKVNNLKNKILHINLKNVLTIGTHSVIFTHEKEVKVWKLIIKLLDKG